GLHEGSPAQNPGHQPHPEHCPGPTPHDRQGHPDDAAHTHARSRRQCKGLEGGDLPAPVGGRSRAAAQDSKHLRQQPELDESGTHREVQGRYHQQRNDQESPQEVVEVGEQVVQDVHAIPFRWRDGSKHDIRVVRQLSPFVGPTGGPNTRTIGKRPKKGPGPALAGPGPSIFVLGSVLGRGVITAAALSVVTTTAVTPGAPAAIAPVASSAFGPRTPVRAVVAVTALTAIITSFTSGTGLAASTTVATAFAPAATSPVPATATSSVAATAGPTATTARASGLRRFDPRLTGRF